MDPKYAESLVNGVFKRRKQQSKSDQVDELNVTGKITELKGKVISLLIVCFSFHIKNYIHFVCTNSSIPF